jgi:hypothetical protein
MGISPTPALSPSRSKGIGMIDPRQNDPRHRFSEARAPHCGFCESRESRLAEMAVGDQRVVVLHCAGCHAILGAIGPVAKTG